MNYIEGAGSGITLTALFSRDWSLASLQRSAAWQT